MARPSLAEKDILNPSEAIEYFVLSRRKFYDLLNNTDGEEFLAYYGERKLILRVAFETAHNCVLLSYRRIRRYLVCRLKRLEASDLSHVRFTGICVTIQN